MQNITQEKIENDYKEAIRNKYVSQKESDEYSYYLDNPSQALLRDLCREILKSNPRTDDLNVYRIFFKDDFDPNDENTSAPYTDKFRKIGDLYREGKKSTKINTLDLAAILVDFQPRPFKKFKEKGFIEIDKIEGPAGPTRNPYRPEIFFAKIDDKQEGENIIEIKEVYFKEDKNLTKDESLIEEDILDEEEDLWEEEILNGVEIPNGEENSMMEESPKEDVSSVEVVQSVGFFGEVKKRSFIERILENSKRTIIATAIIFSLIAIGTLGTVIYFEFLKKGCIQWSGDHYDEVSCELEVQGAGTFNSPETYDERIINLRRIQVCDTTTFFINNKAVVWYAKVGDNAEFFNTHGMHPENGKALRPVTHYIINKYVKNHCK
ncbi:hypothetical protein GKZ90_0016995 [Flavobacterium sp. MC2016-06]|jgi:hypothetical protein|uniref:hypothetical protein n=1 Tax=Flavobacterium sp. MC2016-06 TaxID=2676308 RepID=UPI0012BAF1F5|nr:hypothetical protein [Flavobacterium sp. MC2016-06]MBU3861685.1 hypothetical protein [Flavobacterium sp. MC2016-06]